MTDKEKKERKELRVEIRARKIVIKKLATAIKAIEQTCTRERKEREAEREKLLTYKTYQEAQDAYGWGLIDEAEFDKIAAFLESSQEIVDEGTANDLALKILTSWRSDLTMEIAEIEFDLLPEKEQKEIRQRNMEILQKRAERDRKQKEQEEPYE